MKSSNLGYHILYILLGLSLVLLYTSPSTYNIEYVNYSFIIFLFSTIILLYNNIRAYRSIFIFEVLFSFSFIFVNYIYPTILYTTDPYFSLFTRAFNENVITKATSLATVAFLSFSIGIYQRGYPNIRQKRTLSLKPLSSFDLIILLFLLIIFLIGNISALSGGYSMSGGGGFFFIFSIFYIYKYFAFSHNCISTQLKVCFFSLLLCYIGLSLIMGNRGEPLYIIVAIVYCYNRFVKRISIKRLIALGLMGLSIFYIVGKVRISSNQVGIHSQSEKLESLEGETNILRYANELIINNRALYVLVDYTDKNDFSYGLTWSMNLFSVIPFGQSFALYVLSIPPTSFSSTYLTTLLEFGENDKNSFGMGTNVVGDVYLCFGSLGVIIFMFLFGCIIRSIHNKSLSGRSYYQIAYIVFIILAIYYPRATLLSPLQILAWTYGLTYIYKRKRLNYV